MKAAAGGGTTWRSGSWCFSGANCAIEATGVMGETGGRSGCSDGRGGGVLLREGSEGLFEEWAGVDVCWSLILYGIVRAGIVGGYGWVMGVRQRSE